MTNQRILTEKLVAVRFTGSRYMTSQVKGVRATSNRTPDIAVMCLDLHEGCGKKYWSLFFWQLIDQPRMPQ